MNLPSDVVERLLGELAGVDLGDARREERLRRIVEKVARAPSKSLPSSLGSDAEVQAAYRLMNNEDVAFDDILAPHIEAAGARAKGCGTVLVLHDTTLCEFPALDPKELGYLNTGKAGFPLHYSVALNADHWRRPLGVIHAEALHRTAPKRRRKGKRKPSGSDTANVEDKEFGRWWRGMELSEARHGPGCDVG